MNRMIPIALAVASLFAPVSAQAQFSFFGGGNSEETAKKAEAQVNEFTGNKPVQLRAFFRALFLEGERNAVLNFNHLGLAAMETGHWDIAKKAFDQAILRIDAIYASDENAKKAKSIWNEEKIKDWKGEPYERVMTYYYRGLLYLRDGEFDNAAAAFRAADYQDTQAEQEEYQGDFGLMPFMAAWSQSCRGNIATAKDLYEMAVAKDKSVAPLSTEMRFLVLVDSGLAPVKYGDGQYKEILKIRAPADGRDKSLNVVALEPDAFTVAGAWPVGDVQMQAETRGGRLIDGILNGKAQWKEGAETAGKVATNVGLAAMQVGLAGNNRDMAGAGAIVGLLGMFATMAANAMTPAADVRRWGSLPNVIYAASLGAAPPKPKPEGEPLSTPLGSEPAPNEGDSAGENADAEKPADAAPAEVKPREVKAEEGRRAEPKVKIEFETAAGKQARDPILVITGGPCGLAWTRTRSALMPGDGGTALVSPAPKFEDTGREKQNGIFRSQLFQIF